MRILVVEDNHRLSSSLKLNLEHEGYSVDTAYDGQEGQDFAELTSYDLIILDILLPVKDGLEVCRQLRLRRNHTPILLLTARDSVDDRVQGLDCGADDYLVKPFALRELLARLRALLRRQQPYTTSQLEMGSLIVDSATHSVEREGHPIDLTASAIQQLQAQSASSAPTSDVVIAQQSSHNWHSNPTYHIVSRPLLSQNTRIAMLMVGLERQVDIQFWQIWLFQGLIALIMAAIGGYWLAGKALRPVKMITRTAQEINATDLRRRLHLRRKDEFGELAATFDQMLARLEAAFKRQAQFTADASHELRTPLTIIDLEVNRALTQLEKPEEYRQVLQQIQAENEQMAVIVNSLLLLARADTGQTILRRQEVDLSDLVLASVERLLPLARQSQVTLATGALPELLMDGDAQCLGQMLTNLIENGIKYTSGIGKQVRVELVGEQNWGIVRVQDDGPGIATEHLPYLFERFYRVDRARSRQQRRVSSEPGGTGLGLAIAQWIANAHNGEIHVKSQTGAGTLFEVRLPLTNEETKPDGFSPA